MKTKIAAGIVMIMSFLLMTTSVFAAGFGLSPSKVEFDVPAAGSKTQEFVIYNFNGKLEVSLENIPLRVETQTIQINADGNGEVIELTFYGDELLGNQVFDGKICFLAKVNNSVGTGIKVKAKINQIGSSQMSSLSQPESEAKLEQPVKSSEKAVNPAESSDSWFSSVTPTYGFLIVILLFLILIMLIAVLVILNRESY